MRNDLLNRFIIILTSCSLCLQSCRSDFQVTSEGPALKKSRKTSGDEQAPNQALLLDVSSSAFSGTSNSGLPTAASATSPAVVISTGQVASPTRHLAVRPGAVSDRERTFSMEPGEIDTKPSARLTAQVAERSSVDCCLASLGALSLQPPAVFGSQAWSRYFGEVGAVPSLPSDVAEILGSPCPFWPGKAVKDTHLLVLMPSTVGGEAFTLDLLEDLIQNPRWGGYSTRYFLYDDAVQQSSGDVYSSNSYWILLTHDVLPGSRNKPYVVQQALVAAQTTHINHAPYEIPNVLEAATAILSHYVRSGHRLYEATDELPSTSTRCTGLLEDASGHPSPITVGRFCSRGLVFLSEFDDDAEFGVSCLRRFGSRYYRPSALLHSFGVEEWSRYFGEVKSAPPLPARIFDTLNSPCPFWPDRQVKDTHLLVLIPASVNGRPFSLTLLGELIKNPKGEGYATRYKYCNSFVRKQFGAQSSTRSYWVLITRDVLEGSRGQWYSDQQALVAAHASRTGLPYELPGALEAATAVLSHYVHSRERLYTDAPWTHTRCQELVARKGSHHPVSVGGFASGGIYVDYSHGSRNVDGVAGLRKF